MKHLMETIRRSRAAVIGLGVLISVVAFVPVALSRNGSESRLSLTVPVSDADDCKQGGWRDFNGVFKNQGDCVSYVVTGGRNQPSGINAPTSTTSAPTVTAAPTTPTVAPTTTLIAGLTSDQCKKGGWRTFGVFKNQGDCLSFVATGGANPPDGA